MSMRTFLLLVFEGKTELDYWVDAIVNSGIYYMRDDLIGLCKFAGTPDRVIEPAFQALYGVEVTRDDMMHATQRPYLRGLLPERKQGTTPEEYVLPARTTNATRTYNCPTSSPRPSGRSCAAVSLRSSTSK
jgi:aldehyde:ferredoxin oxidoreductase